jgi:hypothetical protein
MTLTKKILPLATLVAVVLPAGQAAAAPKPKIRFTATTYAVAENTGSLSSSTQNPDPGYGVLTVTRQRRGKPGGTAPAVSVSYRTSDGSATAGSDYTAVSGNLDFPACPSSPASDNPCLVQKIRVPIIDDSSVENVETVNVDLRPAGTTAVLVNPSHAVLNIVDNDALTGAGTQFQLASASDDVSEANGKESVFILRSGDLAVSGTVDYATADGSALAGSDYTSTSGTATFNAGDIFVQVDVPVTNDSTAESTENFSFNLSNPSVGSLGSIPSEQVNIIDNDSPAAFEFAESSYSIAENGGELLVTVRATGNLGNNGTTVHFTSADGSATAGSDYSDATGDLLFDQGDVSQIVAIPIIDDSTDEPDETINLNLSDDTHPSWDAAVATILDDDQAPAAPATTTDNGGTPSTDGGAPQGGGSQEVLGARQSACGLTIKASKKQKLLKSKVLKLTLKSAQNCKVSLATTIKQAKSSKKAARSAKALRFKGKNASLSLQPNKAKTVKVKFTKKTLKAIKKALQARKKLVATVVVTVKDSASKTSRKTLKITIRR